MAINRCHGKEYEKQGIHGEYPDRSKFIFANDLTAVTSCVSKLILAGGSWDPAA